MLNQARLKALKVREDHVESVLDDARQQLGNVTSDQGKYSQVLYSLILQGLLQVNFHWHIQWLKP
jgi:V-type H+-transporting ATPase subunit E